MGGRHMTAFHWLSLTTYRHIICPPVCAIYLVNYQPIMPCHHCTIIPSCAMCHPCSGDTCHLWLFPSLNWTLSAHNFCIQTPLMHHLHHWKFNIELYAFMSFSREFGMVEFIELLNHSRLLWTFQILLDLCELSGSSWTSMSILGSSCIIEPPYNR